MKKYEFIVSAVLLSACAGTPPEWWNPGNVYSPKPAAVTQPKHAQPAAKRHAVTAAPKAAPVAAAKPAEESLNWTEEDFEEMALDPLDANADDTLTPSILGE